MKRLAAIFTLFKKKKDDSHEIPGPGPDFSDINSLEKAKALFEEGKLGKLHLMPLAFGGDERAANTLYVPIGIAAIKGSFDMNVVKPLIEAGRVCRYNATPHYQGDSFIPIAINIVAHDPGQISQTIKIWGEALTRKE